MDFSTIVTLTVGQMQTNCYLLIDKASKKAAIIDPGEDADYIIDKVEELHITPVIILATHGHFDHIMAAFVLQHTWNLPFVLHEKDKFLVERMQDSAKHFLKLPFVDPAPAVTKMLRDGELIDVGETKLSVLSIPGHTPGSVAFYQKKAHILLVGDTIFSDGFVGRIDFSYGNASELAASIRKVLTLPAETVVYPGHGPAFTVQKARQLF